MAKGPPKTVALNHDDYHAEHVGRLADGRQFFLTIPFVGAEEVGTATGREFIALYIFDKAGQLQSATIDDLGPRVTLDIPARLARREALLGSLGPVKSQRIKVAPFRIEMFGVEFAGFDDGSGLGIRPLLLPDGFEGTPLRKSFQLAARASKPWPGAKEPGEGHETAKSPSRRRVQAPGVPPPEWGPR